MSRSASASSPARRASTCRVNSPYSAVMERFPQAPFSPWAAAGYLLMALACCAVVVLYARRKLPLWLAGGLFVALNVVMVPYAQTFGEFKEEFLQSMCLEHGGAEWDAARGRCVGGSYNL